MHSLTATIKAHSVQFIENRAAFGGGAMNATHGSIHLGGNLNFTANLALKENGGAINFDTGVFTIAGNAHFLANSASENGGALWLNNVSFTLMNSSAFLKNGASKYGGAIFLSNFNAVLNGTIAEFENNSAESGGGVYSSDSRFSATSKMKFDHNFAQRRGAGLYLSIYTYEGLVVVVSAASFVNNTAVECGGACFVEQGRKIHFKNLLAAENSESALCILQCRVNFSGTTIISKNTGKLGGGIQIISWNYVLFSYRTCFLWW